MGMPRSSVEDFFFFDFEDLLEEPEELGPPDKTLLEEPKPELRPIPSPLPTLDGRRAPTWPTLGVLVEEDAVLRVLLPPDPTLAIPAESRALFTFGIALLTELRELSDMDCKAGFERVVGAPASELAPPLPPPPLPTAALEGEKL